MARLLQSIGRVLGLNPSPKSVPKFPRSIDTDFSIFREGDRAIIHGRNPSLTKPLQKGSKTDVRRGALEHNSIIGRRVREQFKATRGSDHRLGLPTLEEYVSLTPRLVTPIYAADANLIVSLLDIHVPPPTDANDQPPLEILESGTGHGSLTLHLARAIQAANSNPPPIPIKSQIQHLQDQKQSGEDQEGEKAATAADGTIEDQTQQQWDLWRSQRKAIIHTVDVSGKFSALAEKTVRGFRRGIYAGNVDFYVGHAENWIAEQTAKRKPAAGLLSLTPGKVDPFLSYAILDMPSAQLRIPHVAPIMKRDGILAVFMPSVTQIGECMQLIRQLNLPFVQEKVVELGSGISSGRLWDVRFAVKKSRSDPSSWAESSGSDESDGQVDLESSSDGKNAETAPPSEEESVLVCRPKVGLRIVGGGFVGIWRRIEDSS